MKLIGRFLLCVLIGIAGHQTNKIIEPLEYPGDSRPPVGAAWYRVLRYAIGGVMLGIAQLVMLGNRRDADGVIGAYFMGAVGVGSGVALGYWLDER